MEEPLLTMSPEEAKALFRELRNSAREAAHARDADREAILSRRRTLRRMVASLPFDEDVALAVSDFAAHVDSRLERLEHREGAAEVDSLEITELRGDLAWLQLLPPENVLRETLKHLCTELDSLSPKAAELAALGQSAGLTTLTAAVELIDDIEDRKLGETAGNLAEEEEPEIRRLWYAYLEARDLQLRTGRAEATCDELREQIIARVEAMSPEEAAPVLTRGAAEYDDIVLDLLAAQAEAGPKDAAGALADARRELVWIRVLTRDKVRGAITARVERPLLRQLKGAARRLEKAHRKLKREEQELRLQARQEEIFGARAVAWFENLILWLILLVLVVLIAEAVLPDAWPPEGATQAEILESEAWRPIHRILSWVDAGICLVFLIEFFGKLWMVKGRFTWFWRHFLVDLVPSIPYGLVAAHALDNLRAGRALRIARLPRLLRYVRFVRPLIRFMRFFGFLQRGLDRLVRLHGGLLNRNIVMFEPARIEEGQGESAEIRSRLHQLRLRARRGFRRILLKLEPELASKRIRSLILGFPGERELLSLPVCGAADHPEAGRYMRAEELIATLTRLDAGAVEAEIGQAGAARITATLQRLDAPLLRDLPVLRQMIPPSRAKAPLEGVAAAAKALGRYIQKRLAIVHWISDLSGVITGPQFMDRLGSGMVQATIRPAKRLLLFGLGFLLLKGMVHLMFPAHVTVPHGVDGLPMNVDLPFLVRTADWLERTLGTAFLVLGSACLIILMLGRWFRRVAGEATDFFNRTAEAHYLNLLEEAKLVHKTEDLTTLYNRVLLPDDLLSGKPVENGAEDLERRFDLHGTMRDRRDRVLRLYDDYLDGALFHITDSKTSSQLLGNIALASIRTHCLKISKKDRRRLDELDLDRQRSAVRGPYLWFRSVTHSITQWTAKLILEYNRHAIPRAERENHPAAVRAAHEKWLAAKIRGDQTEPEDHEEAPFFVTTWFSAFHFLTVDQDRDHAVAERFGERTLTALKADRRAMIRTVFGTYPFHRRPRPDRTVNPFQLYYRYLAGGKVLLLPLYMLGGSFAALGWLVRRFRETLREILRPDRLKEEGNENWASYDVAVRKIHRMRKPIYMECARFRALFDPEYLGLDLLPGEDSGVEGKTYREDLERIRAWDEEWDVFEEIRDERDMALAELERMAERAGGPECLVWDLGASEDRNWKEAWRALSIAFAVDFKGARSLVGLEEKVEELLRDAIGKKGRIPGTSWWQRATWNLFPARGLRTLFETYLVRYGPRNLTEKESRWAFRTVRANGNGLKQLVELGAALPPDTTPREAAKEILGTVVSYPENWSEQLVTLRAVQSLSVLDVRNYRRQVWTLGGYGNE
jgi:Ion transport protein